MRRALISGLGCLALDLIVAGWGLAVFLGAFAAIHDGVALVHPTGVASWLLAIALHDLAYYAFHRASHRVTVLWAAHVVHHQSDRYDLTVSLRQGAVATWVTYAFYLPLALAIDAPTFLVVHAAYQVYQFFVHVRGVRSLGPLDWILATPSHHRVHHSSERRHRDRNYGGFFILFDRLLGTFTPEDREPSYGVPGGFAIASPLAAASYMYLRLVAASGRGRIGVANVATSRDRPHRRRSARVRRVVARSCDRDRRDEPRARRMGDQPARRPRLGDYLSLPTTQNLSVATTPAANRTGTSYLPSALIGCSRWIQR